MKYFYSLKSIKSNFLNRSSDTQCVVHPTRLRPYIIRPILLPTLNNEADNRFSLVEKIRERLLVFRHISLECLNKGLWKVNDLFLRDLYDELACFIEKHFQQISQYMRSFFDKAIYDYLGLLRIVLVFIIKIEKRKLIYYSYFYSVVYRQVLFQ